MENVNEIWKDIKGYPEYQISNYGRVWSKYRQKYKKPRENNRGYLQVNLKAINGKWKNELVHRLVAITFLDNPNHYPEVNHINRQRHDCRVENLEWCDRKTNVAKSTTPQRIAVYDSSGVLVGIYDSERQACKELGLNECNVSACLSNNNTRKIHKGFSFRKI